ncbi:MAG: phosphoribosylglycinamide synthetase C domain-containing protein, partial [Prosthecobacter sp.]
NGGRVLAIVAQGGTRHEARDKAYAESRKVTFDGLQRRSDIGTKNFEYAGSGRGMPSRGRLKSSLTNEGIHSTTDSDTVWHRLAKHPFWHAKRC